jgi:hypothetical protein
MTIFLLFPLENPTKVLTAKKSQKKIQEAKNLIKIFLK